jgi:hypothetical protein
VWSRKISDDTAKLLLSRLRDEVEFQMAEGVDQDLAYVVDIVKRALSREIYDYERNDEFDAQARELLEIAAEVYPSLANYEPEPGTKPNPAPILVEIAARTGDKPSPDGHAARVRRAQPRTRLG